MSNRYFALWPKGQPRHMNIPATALFYNVAVSARRFPDKPCPVFCDKQISFAGFEARVRWKACPVARYAQTVRAGCWL